MRHIFLFASLIGICAVKAGAQEFVVSGSGGHPGLTEAESARVIKISDDGHGNNITVDGTQTNIAGLKSALNRFAEQKGEIWYGRTGKAFSPSTKEPLTTAIIYFAIPSIDPFSAAVFKVAADSHLPVRFCPNADFAHGIVREVQNPQDLILTSPSPGYPASAKTHGIGGGGVFRQHIDDQTGTVTSVTVKQSTGHTLLDRCAVEALRQWRYKAPTKFKTVAVPITFVPAGSHVTR